MQLKNSTGGNGMQLTRHCILMVLISAFVSPLGAMETINEQEEQKSDQQINEINKQISELELYLKNIDARFKLIAADAEKILSPSINRKNPNVRKDVRFNDNRSNTQVRKLSREELEEQIKVARRNLKIIAGTALVIGITIGTVATKYYINPSKGNGD